MTNRSSRIAYDTIDNQINATSRILHVIVRVQNITFQVVVLYALPACSPGAKQFNGELLASAVHATRQSTLPAIIMGDYNGDPFLWDWTSVH